MEYKHLLPKFATDTRKLWDRSGVRQAVRDNLDKITKCRTPALGFEIYASETEIKSFCHTCKSRFCTGCGHRATILWQREQWSALPDVRYSEVCFTMPNVFWPLLRRHRELLHDIAALGASVVRRWVKSNYRVTPVILVIPHLLVAG